MSCIHFKFKSSLEYEKITFDGLHISLADLKEAIMKQKKIGLSNAFRLEVVDAQSKKGECLSVVYRSVVERVRQHRCGYMKQFCSNALPVPDLVLNCALIWSLTIQGGSQDMTKKLIVFVSTHLFPLSSHSSSSPHTVYEDNTETLPRNTSVVIRRIPLANAPKLPKTQ